MATEWGERQPDGSVVVYTKKDDGTITSRRESWEQNQGLPSDRPSTPGTKPVATMRGELAKHDPKWLAASDAQVSAEYARLAAGGTGAGERATGTGPTGTGGMQMVGGLDQIGLLLQQLQQEYQRQRLQDLEIPQVQSTLSGWMPPAWARAQRGGQQPGLSTEQALDAIWRKRPDLDQFYRDRGWDTSNQGARRKVVQDWLGITDESPVRAAGGDPVKAAKALGINTNMYNTSRGNKTIDDMRAELGAA